MKASHIRFTFAPSTLSSIVFICVTLPNVSRYIVLVTSSSLYICQNIISAEGSEILNTAVAIKISQCVQLSSIVPQKVQCIQGTVLVHSHVAD
jgi:hypothetical protein